MTTDPAVTAAAEATFRHWLDVMPPDTTVEDFIESADAAVAAARPIIEAEAVARERERIAAEIEAERDPTGSNTYPTDWNDALDEAARIARGQA